MKLIVEYIFLADILFLEVVSDRINTFSLGRLVFLGGRLRLVIVNSGKYSIYHAMQNTINLWPVSFLHTWPTMSPSVDMVSAIMKQHEAVSCRIQTDIKYTSVW